MSDPRAWLDEGSDATEMERALLGAGKKLAMPDAQEDAIWQALQGKIAALPQDHAPREPASHAPPSEPPAPLAPPATGTAGTAGTAGAGGGASLAGSAAGTAASVASGSLLPKLAIAGLLLLGGGALRSLASPEPAPLASPVAATSAAHGAAGAAGERGAAPAPLPAAVAAADPAPELEGPQAHGASSAQAPSAPDASKARGRQPEPAAATAGPANTAPSGPAAPVREAAPAAPEPAPSVAASAAGPQASSRIAEEAARLKEAKQTLANDPTRGIGLLRAMERDFPGGSLSLEREVLMIQALMAAGQRAEGQRRGEAFLQRSPRSIFAPSVRALLDER